MLSGYEPYLDALTDLLTGSDEARAKKMDAFFNRSDALTALAIRSGEPGTDAPEEGELAEALSAEPSSVFGSILREIIWRSA